MSFKLQKLYLSPPLRPLLLTAATSQNDSIDDGLQLELGPPPVAPLGVVADGVARPHPEPLGDRPVLLQLLGQLALDAERLESGLQIDMENSMRNETNFTTGEIEEKYVNSCSLNDSFSPTFISLLQAPLLNGELVISSHLLIVQNMLSTERIEVLLSKFPLDNSSVSI